MEIRAETKNLIFNNRPVFQYGSNMNFSSKHSKFNTTMPIGNTFRNLKIAFIRFRNQKSYLKKTFTAEWWEQQEDKETASKIQTCVPIGISGQDRRSELGIQLERAREDARTSTNSNGACG